MSEQSRETFSKQERLVSRKEIGLLFEKGDRFSESPFRILWGVTEEEREFPVRLLVSVPKRIMKRAVDRNLIKRRVKEAYRKQKTRLYSILERKGQKINLILVYTSSKIAPYEELEDKISRVLNRLNDTLDQK